MKKALLKYLRNTAIITFCLYIALCALMYFAQDNLLFHPQPKSIAETTDILNRYPDLDTLTLYMSDGTRLNTYCSKDSPDNKQPLLIYFGGNAEEVSHLAEYRPHFAGHRLILVNYRGYGRSSGSPGERTMFSDALEVYDQLVKQPHTDQTRIILIGRSIGSGVATYLSSQRSVKATILITPYESMTAVAQEKYPFVPIDLLIKHRFESEKYAGKIGTPLLALIAKNDVVIPRQHAYRLLKQWKGKTTVLETESDHNSIMNDEAIWKSIEDFIAGL